jgi:fructose-1,6-bisphosphatase/inositol monophosphatase family enzyme
MSNGIAELPTACSGDDAETIGRCCVEEGGRLAMEMFRQPHSITVKGRGNLVTQVDVAIETYCARLLADEFPQHALLSEESNSSVVAANDGWTWVLDPLDGTRNYVSGIPFFCINLALLRNGEPVLAMTYDPIHDELFRARKGGGAWLGDRRIDVSTTSDVQSSVLGIDMGYDDRRARFMLDVVSKLWPGVQSVRIPGSAALGLAYAACGRYDLFVHNCLFPWDIAAGILLVQEAGGIITDREGGPISVYSEGVIAGGTAVHADFARLTAGVPWRQEPSG